MPWLPTISSSFEITGPQGSGASEWAPSISPTCTCRPRRRSVRTEAAAVSDDPNASILTWTPPPVSSRRASAPAVAATWSAPRSAARERAADLGADHVAATAGAEALLELTGGGVHVSIDALGSSETAAASVLTLRRRGRHVQVGLMLDAHSDAPLPWGPVISKELEIVGSHGMAAADYPELLAMVADGRLDPRRLIGRVVTLSDAPTELAAMDSLVARTPGLVVATVP